MAKKPIESQMSPKRPYLLRAFWEWIVDNRCTPYIVVDARQKECSVPEQFIDNQGRIVLNVSPEATRDLKFDSTQVSFRARFSGSEYTLLLPIAAVLAVYAAENNHGIVFEQEDFSGLVGTVNEKSLEVKDENKPRRKRFSRRKKGGKKSDAPHLEVIK